MPPPSKLVKPPARLISASSRASGVPCRTWTGLVTLSVTRRQPSTPWLTAGKPLSSDVPAVIDFSIPLAASA